MMTAANPAASPSPVSLKGLVCAKIVKDSGMRAYGFVEMCGRPPGHEGRCGR